MQLGKYEIIAELGQGGFGIVYKARDLTLEREVALKVLHPALAADADFLQRFRKEARLLAQLEHPNVVPIYEFNQVEGRSFIAMRYLGGGSLAERIRHHAPIPEAEVLRITRQVISGLAYAHSRGMIHCDVKPTNILLDAFDNPMITDFGLTRAAQAGSASASSILTTAAGTPSYMPPELWEEQNLTPAVDQYSLACVMVEMLTGEKLFDGQTTPMIMLKHFKPLVLPDRIPVGLQKVLYTALAQQPEKRFADLQAFQQALDGYAQPAPAQPVVSQSSRPEVVPEGIHEVQQGQDQSIPRSIVSASKSKIRFQEELKQKGSPKPNTTNATQSNGLPTKLKHLARKAQVIQENTQNITLSDRKRKTEAKNFSISRKKWLIPAGIALLIVLVLIGAGINASLKSKRASEIFMENYLQLDVISPDNASRLELLYKAKTNGGVYSIAISPDGTHLAMATNIGLYSYSFPKLEEIFKIQITHFYKVTYSPDGTILASGDRDGIIRLWDSDTGKMIKMLEGHTDQVFGVAFSPDGKTIASGGPDNTLRLWDVDSGKQLRVLRGYDNHVECVAFSPDGKILASGYYGGPIILWDVETGRQLHVLETNEIWDAVDSVLFSQNGEILISGHYNGAIRWWSTIIGTQLKVLEEHENIVRSIVFSPSGEILVSGGSDDTILRDARTGLLLKALNLRKDQSGELFISPDGRIIVTGSSYDNVIRIWGIP